ncbi:RluA family pseudouridine synthase [Peptoniphilus sp. KCTC 25270]|uniref:RluA family pseudouridine synthase n=1 Tax=Peptoniphilus sp. KCTC 25270 TaxID=2897414 RepID=UPI001E5A1134|nr:RluA family pseudouridine synthase [Peptoniphilus sp. KCTC 25270]MCD1146729.1 RluA family pseudouridine synthase [Peptoniphilus sp. KCTC 25270]
MDDLKFPIDRDYKELRNFLQEKKFSQKFIGKVFREGRIFVNEAPSYKTMPLEKGDEIRIVFEEEEIQIPSVEFQQEILYEDEDLLVVNKSPGLAIMPCRTHPDHTFANEIADYFRKNNIHRKIRILGRLDKDTTGVMVVAKNPYALRKMELYHTKEKEYITVVEGKILEPMRIEKPIGMGEDSMVREIREDGQEAITNLWPIKHLENATVLKVTLETGRTHQIRCHLKSIGHPVLGDVLYGGKENLAPRTLLHVENLSILHPRKGVKMKFTAPIPKDMKDKMEL